MNHRDAAIISMVYPKELVKQASDSDCYNACLASLTGIPLKEFPVINREEHLAMDKEERDSVGVRQDNECLEVLRKHNWMWLHAYQMAPMGWSIGSGKSPRGDWWHSVICLNGEPALDPHESNGMLDGKVQDYKCLYRLVPK